MEIKQLFKTNEQPIIINRLGNNNYIYTYVIETGNEDVIDIDGKTENKPYWLCTWVKLAGLPNYSDCAKAIIRNYYTLEEEFKFINVASKMQLDMLISDEEFSEYKEYLETVNIIKDKVRNDFNIQKKDFTKHNLIKNSDIESFIKIVSNKLNLSDEDAVNIKSIYPTWEELIGKEIDVDTKLIYNDRLFKALVKHTVQTNWLPTDAATVYVEINEQNKGTVEDPIPYNGNMILYANKYYSQNNIIYKCIRDSVIPLYNSLNDLINIYVEVHNV